MRVKIYKTARRHLDVLVRDIRALVRPNSWEHSGGQGVLYALPADGSIGYLLVRQTGAAHAELQEFLKHSQPAD